MCAPPLSRYKDTRGAARRGLIQTSIFAGQRGKRSRGGRQRIPDRCFRRFRLEQLRGSCSSRLERFQLIFAVGIRFSIPGSVIDSITGDCRRVGRVFVLQRDGARSWQKFMSRAIEDTERKFNEPPHRRVECFVFPRANPKYTGTS